MTEASKGKTRAYVLLHGNHFAVEDGRPVEKQPGDIIHLTDGQAEQFADKVQSKAEYVAEQAVKKAKATALEKAEADAEAAAAEARAKALEEDTDGEEENEEEEEEQQ